MVKGAGPENGVLLPRPVVAVVPGNRELEERIFEFWTGPDIVHDQGPPTIGRAAIHHHADVREVSGQHPGDEISRGVVLCVARLC